ncbi:transglutaminase domain protein [Stanieria cyanosphaera PCC 7437]|uniref:Transglutaminase domain protein n=1 Tax=Stanieria cyanosphaera (strain ATCC 29371 / PCC 7437) TaxID=111780 RepID=K9XS58_STAC7|nr:transglutaminase family protein [Stanieria cyanosphaera]AFZ34507.1 transglutaminase domain protein [Stanieria cyanosphaera PCC 7437]
MLYQISHQTTYTYSQTVSLNPHFVRLCPRCDHWQKLHNFSLLISPQPQGISELIDLDGNNVSKVWFNTPTNQLNLQILAQVETWQTNPFNYLLQPWTTTLPLDYPSSLYTQLKSYLKPYSFLLDTVIVELAEEIIQEVNANTVAFLSKLNQCIYENCQYITRETGEPWQAGITWRRKQGSCRDFAILFMEVCRAVGLAARFVSGYQEGDPEQQERDLHAWAEVYLPGAGWRGYDPTHGLAVSDRNIALAASAIPSYTAPVSGTVNSQNGTKADSRLAAQIMIKSI